MDNIDTVLESKNKPEIHDLFIKFLRAHPKANIQNFLNELSLDRKLYCVQQSHKDISRNVKPFIDDWWETKNKGHGNLNTMNELLRHVRHFFFDVYSYLESIARMYHFLCSPANKPPIPYSSQRESVIERREDYEEFERYASFLETQGWYDIFRDMRTEETHFLQGYLNVEKKNGNDVINYFNRTYSNLPGRPDYIEVKNIINYCNELMGGVYSHQEFIEKEVLRGVDVSRQVQIMLHVEDLKRNCAVSISLEQYIDKELGDCVPTEIDCKYRDGEKCRSFSPP